MPVAFDPVFPNCNQHQHVCRPQWQSAHDFFLRSPWTLRQHLILNSIILSNYPPPPCIFFCCLQSSSASCHLPPIICHLILLQNSPPNLVACHCRSCPLSSHCPPPRCLTCRIFHHPLSPRQHCRRCHHCNPILTLTALVMLSASHCPLL